MGKKIAVFPEPGAIGPVMNLVGICQGLRDMGHEAVFVLEPGLKGTVESYGFDERYVSCMEPMSPEAQAALLGRFHDPVHADLQDLGLRSDRHLREGLLGGDHLHLRMVGEERARQGFRRDTNPI